MKIRVFLTAVALAALGFVRLPAAPSLMPIEEVKPGMVGVGRTVFEGVELKEFKVQIIGVLKNVAAPQRNLILARLEGGPLAVQVDGDVAEVTGHGAASTSGSGSRRSTRPAMIPSRRGSSAPSFASPSARSCGSTRRTSATKSV